VQEELNDDDGDDDGDDVVIVEDKSI